MLVRLASLIVLLASLYEVISSCTRPEEDPDDESVCTFAVVTDSIFSNNTNTTVTCPAVSYDVMLLLLVTCTFYY